MKIQIKKLHPDAILPTYAHGSEEDAAMDLYAVEARLLTARTIVATGIAVAIPQGYVGLIVPRSGLAIRGGVTVANSPGVIDSGYRGEIRVGLISHAPPEEGTITITPGQRIAQLLIQRVEAVEWEEVTELSESARGDGGFGSTGR